MTAPASSIPPNIPRCGECGEPFELRCPCGRAACAVRTAVPFCPKCDTDKLGKWQTAHSIGVCEVYILNDQLAESSEQLERLTRRAERAEQKLDKAMAALREMRTVYEQNKHAQEWARFLETALECCGLCGQEVDPRFKHECPAHYLGHPSLRDSAVDFSKGRP